MWFAGTNTIHILFRKCNNLVRMAHLSNRFVSCGGLQVLTPVYQGMLWLLLSQQLSVCLKECVSLVCVLGRCLWVGFWLFEDSCRPYAHNRAVSTTINWGWNSWRILTMLCLSISNWTVTLPPLNITGAGLCNLFKDQNSSCYWLL